MSLKTLAFILTASFLAAPLAAQTRIGVGETVTGTLEEGDRQMDDGAYYDSYVLRGRPGETLIVRMTSEDFDTYLHWGAEAEGDWVEEDANDDSGDGTDSRLVIRLPEEAEFELRAAGFDEDESGEYQLEVTAMQAPSASRIRVGQTVRGELDESDHEGEAGYEDHYVITGAPGTQITVFAESDDFDTYVAFGPWRDGWFDATADDDDGGRGTNSEMVAEFGEGGEHHVVVRSYLGDETGAYTLRVVEGAASENWNDEEVDTIIGEVMDDYDEEDDADEDADEDDDSANDVDFTGTGFIWIEAGGRIEAVLNENSAQDGDGGYYQQFGYEARAGERLTIRVESDDLDAFVRIGTGTRAQFETIAEDDDGGGELNAELVFQVPRSGEYTIQVSAAAPGQTGVYVLTVESSR